MIFYYNKIGLVKSYSDVVIDHDSFEELEYTPTENELQKMKLNYKLSIVDKKLVFEKPVAIVNQEKEENKTNKLKILKEKIILSQVITPQDILELINNL